MAGAFTHFTHETLDSTSAAAMALDFNAAADEYLGWLQLEANRSPNTVRAYGSDIKRLGVFL